MNKQDNLPVREADTEVVRNAVSRDVNEDRLLQVSEANLALKKHIRKQDERMRQLATKLVRVIGEKSRQSQGDDILIEDQKSRIGELEGQIHTLRSKLSVARQQLGSYTKLVPGLQKQATRPRSSFSSTGSPVTGKVVIPDQVTRLLLEAKGENHALKDQIKHVHDCWIKTNDELTTLKDEFQVKEVEYSEEIAAIRNQNLTDSDYKQKKLAENIQFIRLQRDSKRTANWLATYEAQCRTLEANLNSAREDASQFELQLSNVQDELRNEQGKCLDLLKQVEESSASIHQLKEAKAHIISLQDENRILKESNAAILSKSFENCDKSKETEDDGEVTQLKLDIEKLEMTLKTELKAKSGFISALTQEKAKTLSMEQGIRLLEQKHLSMQMELNSKVTEIEDLKQLLQSKEVKISEPKSCNFCLAKDEEISLIQHQVNDLRLEIGKTRELHKIQVGINREYQEEIDALTTQLANMEALHEKERRELVEVYTENKILDDHLYLMKRDPQIPPSHAFVSFEPPRGQVSRATTPPVNSKEVDKSEEVPLDDGEERSEIQEEGDQQPSLFIYVRQFVPISEEVVLSGLFTTWEHTQLPRQYSPIVNDGIFDSKFLLELPDSFLLEDISVQLHRAIGSSDAQTLGFGTIEIHNNTQSITIRGFPPNNDDIGTLFYSCTLKNCKPAEVQKIDEIATNRDEVTNNSDIQVPIPIPRKLKPATENSPSSPAGLNLAPEEGF